MSGQRRGRVVARCLAVVCAVAVAAGCSSSPASQTVVVDGGSQGVAFLGDRVVAAEPGGVVAIEHGGAPAAQGDEAPMTHAFVGGAGDELPPLFTPAGGGRIPNPAVWGPCTGGDVADAEGPCPVPPAQDPRWDGRGYWSTGAMLPGERREIALGDDVPAGDLLLVCAIHPQLRVVVRTGAEAQPAAPAGPAVDTVLAAAAAQERPAATVSAGTVVDGAYVGRFLPAQVRIRAGESVTWIAGGRAPVEVVFNGEELDLLHAQPADAEPAGKPGAWNGKGELRSGFLSDDPRAGAAGARWRVTFSRPGRYQYASRFGAAWRGVVIVEER